MQVPHPARRGAGHAASSTTTRNRLEIADPGANPFNAQVTGGGIEIKPRPRCVDNDDVPDGTECKGGECRPIIMCDGPMAGPGSASTTVRRV